MLGYNISKCSLKTEYMRLHGELKSENQEKPSIRQTSKIQENFESSDILRLKRLAITLREMKDCFRPETE